MRTDIQVHTVSVLSQFVVYAKKMLLTGVLRRCMICLVWARISFKPQVRRREENYAASPEIEDE